MPVILIADNLTRNRRKIEELIKVDFKEKTTTNIRERIEMFDGEDVMGMEDARQIYGRENTVYLLLGTQSSNLREKIPASSVVISCPIFGTQAAKHEEDMYYMKYFQRIDTILQSKYGLRLF
jgi:hypothetical protein